MCNCIYIISFCSMFVILDMYIYIYKIRNNILKNDIACYRVVEVVKSEICRAC